MRELPTAVAERVNRYCDSMKLVDAKRQKLMKLVTVKYNKALVSPGDAIGIIAAQSIGEPGTQMTLRTKHYAGSLEVSVGKGIQRVIEIVDGRSSARYPSMKIYLKQGAFKSEKDVKRFANSLIDVKVRDIGSFTEDFNELSVNFKLNEDIIKDLDVDRDEVITSIYDKIIDTYASKRFTNNKAQINFHFDKSTTLYAIRKAVMKWMKIPLFGVKNIEKVVVIKDGEAFIIHTRGTNLKDILKLENIDAERTCTNDIFEVNKVLGIEAARHAIVKELMDTFDSNDIKINIRHIYILADLMTMSGEVRGVVRTGITGSKGSPFARAAFEETVKHIISAAFNHETERLVGITENIIVGQPISAGTGMVRLTLDPKNLKKFIAKTEEAKEKE